MSLARTDVDGNTNAGAWMTYDELLLTARRHEGETLTTVTGTRFTVGVYLDCPFFTPESTGLGRSDGRPAARAFVARYNETGSLRPRDYQDVTRNASYYVGLLIAEQGVK
jgi:hypothetical protein